VPPFRARSLGCYRVLAPPSLVEHSAEVLAEPSRGILESFTSPAMSHQIHTFTELRQQIHDDLRLQHPDWVQPNGESPTCDSYEARLVELIDAVTGTHVARF